MKLESKFTQFAQEGGFTLIEMLIVVAIIGIIVAIAVPALNSAKSDAQTSKYKAAQSAVALAKNRHFLKANLTTSATCNLADIDDYLIINGVQATTWSQVSAGTSYTVNSSTITDAIALTSLGMSTNYSGL